MSIAGNRVRLRLHNEHSLHRLFFYVPRNDGQKGVPRNDGQKESLVMTNLKLKTQSRRKRLCEKRGKPLLLPWMIVRRSNPFYTLTPVRNWTHNEHRRQPGEIASAQWAFTSTLVLSYASKWHKILINSKNQKNRNYCFLWFYSTNIKPVKFQLAIK